MRDGLLRTPAAVAVAEGWDWQLRARCRGRDSAIFFDYSTGTAAVGTLDLAGARRICDTCPVMQTCLEYAVAANEPFGVWGGLTPEERRPHRRNVQSRITAWEQALQRWHRVTTQPPNPAFLNSDTCESIASPTNTRKSV